jgi:hypothetical protein
VVDLSIVYGVKVTIKMLIIANIVKMVYVDIVKAIRGNAKNVKVIRNARPAEATVIAQHVPIMTANAPTAKDLATRW